MPSDNQDHVTWSIPSLSEPARKKSCTSRCCLANAGDLATTALVRFSAQSSHVFVVEEPMLSLSVHGPKELMIGDPATQSITIGNPGTGVAHNVMIEARLTKGLEHPHGERLTIQVGSLNPGETRQVRLPLVAIAGGPQADQNSCLGGGRPAPGNFDQNHRRRSRVKGRGRRAELSLRRLQGGLRRSTWPAKGAASNNVHVTHTLPEGFRFVAADKGGEYDEADPNGELVHQPSRG